MEDLHEMRQMGQKLTELDDYSLDLIKLTAFIGGRIPVTALERLRKPRLTWDDNGEIRHSMYTDLAVVSQQDRCQRAIQKLQGKGLLLFSNERDFEIPTTIRRNIERATAQESELWKLRAFGAMLHVFPAHRQLEPAQYATIASELLPQLQHVVRYIEEIRWQFQHAEQVNEAVDACLSASNFLDITWKEQILDAAERLIGPYTQARARLQLRRMTLNRIAETIASEQQLHDMNLLLAQFQRHDKRSNAHLGEMKLFQARLMVDIEQHIDALSVLADYGPLEANFTSRLEQIQLNDIALLRGEIYRYEGRFHTARQCLLDLMDQKPEPRPITHIDNLLCAPPPSQKLVTHLSALSCETGFFEHAVLFLRDELRVLLDGGYPLDCRRATRVRLGLAEAHVMSVASSSVAAWRQGKASSNHLLESISKATTLLDELRVQFSRMHNLGKVGKITRFRVFLASAMACHLSGYLATALEFWRLALTYSRESWPPGYTDAIITYSLADLEYRKGNRTKAESLEQDAVQFLRVNKYRYHITGLGTIWPKYVQTSITVHKR
ncbi:hypothetical protein Purlil1_13057 [Purpureocillium lilacinum]|uniref:Uncharacterized protein n=1 Tax=Purpureocillium lilacinum TaxID=33203 RepID=A0ABR0BFH6_PURLI|nr:hypothetical protein Purlil1_13057 [Purpureocillium lilacinum]